MKSLMTMLGAVSVASIVAVSGGTASAGGGDCSNPAVTSPLILNEIWIDPKGTEEDYEYIEIQGPAGMSLDGYAIAVIAGGVDEDDDGNFNEGDDFPPEIDEFFSLDGRSIGSSMTGGGIGLFVVNNRDGASSSLPAFASYTNSAFFDQIDGDAGKIQNDGSLTVLLLRKRETPGNWDRDLEGIDNDPLDSEIDADLGDYQIVDEISFSADNGKEYTRSEFNEINETPDFKPDQLTRVRYYHFDIDATTNPVAGRGKWDNSGVSCDDTEVADESWVFGECEANTGTQGLATVYGPYDNAFPGSDARNSKGPTDQSAPLYDCAEDPDIDDGFMPDMNGVKMKDMDLDDYNLTPGSFNEQEGLSAGFGKVQFARGDINFNGTVDSADYNIVVALYNMGTSQPTMDDQVGGSGDYVYQGGEFQEFLAAALLDGTLGTTVSAADVAAHPCHDPGRDLYDVTGDGRLDDKDIIFVAEAINDGVTEFRHAADVNLDGVVNHDDLTFLFNALSAQRTAMTISAR